ncbi:MAG: DNA alkylation repair protein [Erysipelotrichaceae bacterium]|nr:DNA alkylation repair protein [Erysipelotrichaceae bacterium]
MDIRNELFKLQDFEYAKFQSKLIPNINVDKIIGVRVPLLRKLALRCIKENTYQPFINTLPHQYYDEYLLHSLIISSIKNYDECIRLLEELLPYMDNWAVCDITNPKIFNKYHHILINDILRWLNSKDEYTLRFGIVMLMSHYLGADFKADYLKLLLFINDADDYYVKMAAAWFYSTALTKRWEDTICYLENNQLDLWIHNKTIQKACDSLVVSKEDKEYLKSLKRK